ncbi:class I SAM-dependent methyltransferase [Pedobacter xixiisoli]|uniref:Methyltransferase domain-containing protein n=1 Tax=Pedobacter xixiisoli TaxID=1476464 RepID=A0A286A9K7_9SPHI|nr:class I SAM-dependent methyltransferase [Pedobacter xixiisoli]SOD18598.1 Methyltransferase domain-containing protein [Pedobacter xixiisoli]
MSEYKDYGYDTHTADHTQNYIWEPLLQMLQHEKIILDLGCGNGALANELITKGFKVYGTDASLKGIYQANKINPGYFFVQDLSSDDLPAELLDKKIQTIISTEVIEHLYDPRAFISFAKKILVKNGGGEIILSTPYHGYLKNLLIAIAGKWDHHADPLWDGGHIKLWSKQTLTTLLEEQGFKVKGFVGCGRLPYLWKSMIIKATI